MKYTISQLQDLFNKYLEMFEDDEEAALMKTPYAGYSEHQTGLAVDFYRREDFRDEDALVYEPKMSHEEVEEKYNRWLAAVDATLKF